MSARSAQGEPPRPARLDEMTEAEWEIMRVVWERQPVPAGTVQDALKQKRNWAYSTVKTTMDRMVAKGLLSAQAIRNLQLFSSRISPAQAKRSEFRRMLRRAFDGALAPMMHFLVEDRALSEKELEELQKNIAKARRRRGDAAR